MSRRHRRAPRRLVFTGAIVASLAAGLGLAVAAGEDEPIRLEYSASAGCPDVDAFMARVRARTTRARLVERGDRDAERARTFTVRLVAGEHAAGSVTVLDGVRSEGTRRLDADTCDQVADALALMVALAVDPRAMSPVPVAPSAPPVPVLPSIDAGGDAGGELDAGPALPDSSVSAEQDSAPPPSPLLPPPIVAPAPALAPAQPPHELHFFAGVDFAVATAVSPTTLFAGAPYVGWRTTAPRFLGADVRVAFLRAGTGTLAVAGTGGGGADFTWTIGRLDGCAMLWPERRLRLGGCARFEAGVLEATGERVPGADTQDTAWVAVGALGRLEWSFLGPFVLDLGAGPAFRITSNNQFFFQANTPAYTVPLLGFSAEGGLGVHFL